MLKQLKHSKRFFYMVFFSVLLTIIFATYISNLLYGKNSYTVYSNLIDKKNQLQSDIKRLQLENANLQKQYLELKNLEPEEL